MLVADSMRRVWLSRSVVGVWCQREGDNFLF